MSRKFEIGGVYSVERAGCYLEKEGGGRIKLRVGDMIQYAGNVIHGGHYQSDPIPTDHFTVYGSGTGGDHPHVGEYGEFWPNDWGVADAKHKHLSKLYDAEEVS